MNRKHHVSDGLVYGIDGDAIGAWRTLTDSQMEQLLDNAHTNGYNAGIGRAVEVLEAPHPTPTIAQGNRALLADLGAPVPPMMRPGVQVIDKYDIGVGVPVGTDPRNVPHDIDGEIYDAPGDHDGRGAAR